MSENNNDLEGAISKSMLHAAGILSEAKVECQDFIEAIINARKNLEDNIPNMAIAGGLRDFLIELTCLTEKRVKKLIDLGLRLEDVNVQKNGLMNVINKLKNTGINQNKAFDLFTRTAAIFYLGASCQMSLNESN